MKRYTSKKQATRGEMGSNYPVLGKYAGQLSGAGGLHRAPIGTSTRDKSDIEDQRERLADFNEELERCARGGSLPNYERRSAFPLAVRTHDHEKYLPPDSGSSFENTVFADLLERLGMPVFLEPETRYAR